MGSRFNIEVCANSAPREGLVVGLGLAVWQGAFVLAPAWLFAIDVNCLIRPDMGETDGETSRGADEIVTDDESSHGWFGLISYDNSEQWITIRPFKLSSYRW